MIENPVPWMCRSRAQLHHSLNNVRKVHRIGEWFNVGRTKDPPLLLCPRRRLWLEALELDSERVSRAGSNGSVQTRHTEDRSYEGRLRLRSMKACDCYAPSEMRQSWPRHVGCFPDHTQDGRKLTSCSAAAAQSHLSKSGEVIGSALSTAIPGSLTPVGGGRSRRPSHRPDAPALSARQAWGVVGRCSMPVAVVSNYPQTHRHYRDWVGAGRGPDAAPPE